MRASNIFAIRNERVLMYINPVLVFMVSHEFINSKSITVTYHLNERFINIWQLLYTASKRSNFTRLGRTDTVILEYLLDLLDTWRLILHVPCRNAENILMLSSVDGFIINFITHLALSSGSLWADHCKF